MRENVLEHVVTTPLPVRMPLQATGQSEKLIVQPCWRAILAQQPLMAAAVSPPGCAILTHRLCYRAQITPAHPHNQFPAQWKETATYIKPAQTKKARAYLS
jgi:hypothetical protein